MAVYPFLSDEWLDAARAIRTAHQDGTVAVAHPIRMNLNITSVPFGEGEVHAHMDTTSGELELEVDHIETVDLTVTLEYDIAKAILVEGNPQAGMQAFMAGKIKVEGDISKLMALQASGGDPGAAEVAARIKAITE